MRKAVKRVMYCPPVVSAVSLCFVCVFMDMYNEDFEKELEDLN